MQGAEERYVNDPCDHIEVGVSLELQGCGCYTNMPVIPAETGRVETTDRQT